MKNGRRKPYTERGIARVPCFRCGKPSSQQWQICADNSVFRAVCIDCDIKLNALVLGFMGFRDGQAKLEAYIREMRG